MKKYILKKEDIYYGDLILINKDNRLKSVTNINELEPYNIDYPNILLNKKALKFLKFILNEINANDKIVPVSGYRSLEEQQKIFNDSIALNGSDFTYKYVALPNSSEHQTGLAIDLGLKMDNIDFIRPSFPNCDICEEFRLYANKYGFIERYKKDKEEKTGISAEEWHFRYIGYPHSEIVKKYNFCLEEYIEFLMHEKVIYQDYEIFYLPFRNEQIEIELGDYDTVSGNNIDGFIVTRKIK